MLLSGGTVTSAPNASLLTVEADSRRLGLTAPDFSPERLRDVTRRGWFYFSSLIAIAVLMASGVTTFRAVFWATVVAIDNRHRLRVKPEDVPGIVAELHGEEPSGDA